MQKKYIFFISLILLLLLIVGIYLVFLYKNNVNIAYMSDRKYLPYMMVSINSAIENKNEKTKYNIYVIAKDFNQEDIEKIKQIEQEKVKINIITAREKTLDYSHLGRFSSFKTAMQKIFLPDYLKDIDKVLYLDSDTIVQKDLSKLYNTNMRNIYIAATKDGLMYQYPEHIKEVGLEWRNFYFNSGIMLLNLKEMRQNNLVDKSIQYFNNHNEVFADQDILNVVTKDKVKEISYRYNVNSTFFEEESASFLSNFFKEKVPQTSREVYDDAVILHFAGHKPWTEWFNHSYLKPLWYEYANRTKEKYKITF